MAKKALRVVANDDNELTDAEKVKEQRFLNGLGNLRKLELDLDDVKVDIKAETKVLTGLGYTKDQIKFALSIDEEDRSKVIEDMQQRIRILTLLGVGAGRQLSLIESDPLPLEERAYHNGLAAGRQRKDVTNPMPPGTREYERWEDGNREGHQLANAALAEAMDSAPL